MGEIPDRVLTGIGECIVHRLAVGLADITGNDFGTIFASAVGGVHRDSPLGLADVFVNGTAWSVKTIQVKKPEIQQRIRLISGRNSPDYSLGISDPRKSPRKTGRAVLEVWNERVNQSKDHHDELRVAVFLRNIEARKFCLFEATTTVYPPDDYHWKFNKNGNLEGRDKSSKEHVFTWQPHGSQFAIYRRVPGSARFFFINQTVPVIEQQHVLRLVKYNPNWISFGPTNI